MTDSKDKNTSTTINREEYSEILNEILRQEDNNEGAYEASGIEDEKSQKRSNIKLQSRYGHLTYITCGACILQILLTLTLFLLSLLQPQRVTLSESRSVILRKLGPDARFFIAFEKLTGCFSSAYPCTMLNKLVSDYNNIFKASEDGFPDGYREEDFFVSGFITTEKNTVIYRETGNGVSDSNTSFGSQPVRPSGNSNSTQL